MEPDNKTAYARIDWPGSPSRAFTSNDFVFLGDNERHLSLDELGDDLIKYLTIEWRVQKNGQNGQKVTFGDDPDSPEYSATRAGYRIYQRAKRLGMKPHEPLAVYLNDRGKVRYITDSLVNGLLREAAGTTLNLQHNTTHTSSVSGLHTPSVSRQLTSSTVNSSLTST